MSCDRTDTGEAPLGAGKRMLIVDDARLVRVVLRSILEGQGYEVVGEAGNAEEGLRAYDRLKPDGVTFDIVMPGQRGTGAIKSLKDRGARARVVVVSSVKDEAELSLLRVLGVPPVVSKPPSWESLRPALEAVGLCPTTVAKSRESERCQFFTRKALNNYKIPRAATPAACPPR